MIRTGFCEFLSFGVLLRVLGFACAQRPILIGMNRCSALT